jgi:hypothetical protein
VSRTGQLSPDLRKIGPLAGQRNQRGGRSRQRPKTDVELQRLGRDEVNQLTEACSKNPDGKIKLGRELSVEVS